MAGVEEIETKPRHPEHQYLDLMREIQKSDDDRAEFLPDNQGIRCIQGASLRFSLRENTLPLLTTKDVYWKGVQEELLWFIKPDTNAATLAKKGVNIWNEDAYRRYQRAARKGESPVLSQEEYVNRLKTDPDFEKWGDLGPVYGEQWRRWETPDGREIDQMQQLIDQLRNPVYRYRKSLIVSAWNPSFLPGNTLDEKDEMALAPCHVMFQADVQEKTNRFSLIMFQRSADVFLGLPFNIASYGLLAHMLAQVTGLEAHQLVMNIGNAHLYHRHFEQVQEQLTREPRPFPKIRINSDIREIDDFKMGDFKLRGYNPHDKIKASVVAVGGRIDNPIIPPGQQSC